MNMTSDEILGAPTGEPTTEIYEYEVKRPGLPGVVCGEDFRSPEGRGDYRIYRKVGTVYPVYQQLGRGYDSLEEARAVLNAASLARLAELHGEPVETVTVEDFQHAPGFDLVARRWEGGVAMSTPRGVEYVALDPEEHPAAGEMILRKISQGRYYVPEALWPPVGLIRKPGPGPEERRLIEARSRTARRDRAVSMGVFVPLGVGAVVAAALTAPLPLTIIAAMVVLILAAGIWQDATLMVARAEREG